MKLDSLASSLRAIAIATLLVMAACVDRTGESAEVPAPIVSAPPPEPSISLEELLAIRALLAAEDFPALEQRLAWNADSARRDPGYEGRYAAAFDGFAVLDSATGQHLDRWVAKDSGASVARLARGAYRLTAEHDVRGDDRSVTDEEASHVEDWQRLAAADIVAAAHADSTNVMVYAEALDLGRGTVDLQGGRRLLDNGLRQVPNSLILRFNYMWLSRPRWAGSRREMASFAAECDSAAVANPRLRLVRGMIPRDSGVRLYNRRRNGEAVDAYDDAMAYGDHWQYRWDRGEARYFSRDYVHSINDFTAALRQRPGLVAPRARRAEAYARLGQKAADAASRDSLFALAREDLAVAVLLDRGNITLKDVAEVYPGLLPSDRQPPPPLPAQ